MIERSTGSGPLRGQERWWVEKQPLDLETWMPMVDFARTVWMVRWGRKLGRRGGGVSSGREGMEAVWAATKRREVEDRWKEESRKVFCFLIRETFEFI